MSESVGPGAGFPALSANGYRDTWCGQVLGDRVDSEARVAGWVQDILRGVAPSSWR